MNFVTCSAVGCDAQILACYLMCGRHHRLIPPCIRAQLLQHYRPGQEVGKLAGPLYLKAAIKAVHVVEMLQRRPPRPTRGLN